MTPGQSYLSQGSKVKRQTTIKNARVGNKSKPVRGGEGVILEKDLIACRSALKLGKETRRT